MDTLVRAETRKRGDAKTRRRGDAEGVGSFSAVPQPCARNSVSRESAAAIEYALIATLISVAAVLSFDHLGNQVDNRYQAINTAL